MGVRRSGKSTFMVQQIVHLLEKGVARHNIIQIHFFDDRLHTMQSEGSNTDCRSRRSRIRF